MADIGAGDDVPVDDRRRAANIGVILAEYCQFVGYVQACLRHRSVRNRLADRRRCSRNGKRRNQRRLGLETLNSHIQ